MISAFSSCLTAQPSHWSSWGQNQDLTIILIGYSHHHNHRPRSNSIQLHYKIVYNSDRIEKLIQLHDKIRRVQTQKWDPICVEAEHCGTNAEQIEDKSHLGSYVIHNRNNVDCVTWQCIQGKACLHKDIPVPDKKL